MELTLQQPRRAPDGAPVHYERHRPEQTTLYRLVQQHSPLESVNSRRTLLHNADSASVLISRGYLYFMVGPEAAVYRVRL